MPLAATVLTTVALVLAGLPIVLLLASGPALLHPRAHRGPNLVALGLGVVLAGALVLGSRCAVDARGSAVGAVAEVALLLAAQVGLALAALLLGWARITWSTRRHPPDEAAAVVVLGAGLMGTRVTRVLADRLLAALRLHGSLRLPRDPAGAVVGEGPPVPVIVSGGQGPDEVTSEAAAMASFLVEHGFDRSAIILEDRATSTRENLIHSADLVAARSAGRVTGSLVVVTNGFHVHRTAALARVLRLDAVVVGAPTPLHYLPRALVRELVALLVLHPRRQVACAVVLAAVGTWVGLTPR